MLAFTTYVNYLILGLYLEAKKTGEDTIWDLIVLEVVIARLDIIAEPGQDITNFETR